MCGQVVSSVGQKGGEAPESYLALFAWLAQGLGAWPREGGRLPPASLVIVPAHLFFFTLSAFEALTETAQNVCVYMVTFHKWLVMFYHHNDYRSLIRRLDKNFDMPEQRTDPEYSEIISRCVKELRTLTVVWTMMVFVTLSSMMIIPWTTQLLSGGGNSPENMTLWNETIPPDSGSFPYRNWTPFDDWPQPYYALLYLYHVFMGATLIYMIPLYDLLYFAFVHHACAQFAVLHRSLEGLRARAEAAGAAGPAAREAHMRRCVASCARHHDALHTFVEGVESIVNPVFLNQFVGSSVLFCMTAFQLAVNSTVDMKMITMGALLVSAVFELGIFCFFGNRVMDDSRGVGQAAYNSEWYHASPATKRSISIIMLRSVRPAKLTFGKFAPLSLETYGSILQISYTYFTVLNRLNE
ncbi:Odorant receptor 13a [Gryllus bimaculatus]|nr:Odorant receptor 13a [Gryllus bimaculatus]